MRLKGFKPSWALGNLLLSTLLYSAPSVAKSDEPSVQATQFSNSPYDLRYFDDSDVVLMQDYTEDAIFRSPDAGATWARVGDIPEGVAWNLIMHPYDNKRAYVLTEDTTHWRTEDRGESWKEFFTDASPSTGSENPLSFHAGDKDRILMNAEDCLMGIFCEPLSVYTLDGFRTDAMALREGTSGCQWAKGTPLFAERHKSLDDNRILCVIPGQYVTGKKGNKLAVSDDFFKNEFEPALEVDRAVSGVAKLAAVKGYILAASVAEGTDEMALYVTSDAENWHRAVFPHDHKMVEEAYTILESTNYSIQIDVMTTRPNNPMGVLLSSNSNGTYFTRNVEHTNRNHRGNVDFEKVAGIQGIILANVVENWEDVEKNSREPKKVKSQISFDDGRTWQALKAGDDDLQIHSVTHASNSGRVFSSLAPGIMMGVGNTGKYLKDYNNGDTYISDDAGLTWKKALEGPHKYEIGDTGSILVAIADMETNELKYSLNHGKDWKTVELKQKIAPYILTTTLDSTSLKFLLVASSKPKDSEEYYIMSIDFDELDKRQCKDDDLEKWYARVDSKGEPTCIMGHKQFFMRRKADADCFVKSNFEDPTPQFQKCDCTTEDYECDFNFVRSADRKECELKGPLVVPDGACKNPEDTFKGSSGWRLIPGDECIQPKSGAKDDPVERKCGESVAPPASGKVSYHAETLPGKELLDHMYFERTETSSGDDETVIAQTDKGVFLSHDHGKTWKQILEDQKIKFVVRHKYLNDRVYFITDDKHVYYSLNRGDNIQKFDTKVPHKAKWSVAPPMAFHPTKKDWIIWIGVDSEDDHAVASISTDRGDSWKTLARYVRKCEFIYNEDNLKQKQDEKLIMCEIRTKESSSTTDNPWKLVSSSNFFQDDKTVFPDILDFATMNEFIVVANKDKDEELTVEASVDGEHFDKALFPSNFHVPHQHGYTVLDSSTHAIFLHVTVDQTEGAEYGGIIKSNSNGTSYVLSLNGVNRDATGYVDFEKMSKLEGVALANVVTNYQTAAKDNKKVLRTMITHNDGAEWRYISAPEKDVDGKKFSCNANNLDKCSLNVHGYTERMDKTHTYSSPSAVGVMLAVGSVGETLEPFDKSDTFITRDAGISWTMVKRGSYMWEYGDQGSIIVLVNDRKPTNVVHYSRDEGATWVEQKFNEEEVTVFDITTLPSDNSRNFLLWTSDKDGKVMAVNLDFQGLTDRQCVLDESNPSKNDYTLWSPRHPTQDNDCLFGHISQYHRKKLDADCYNGHLIEALHSITSNCTCTRQDFECDYNYQALPGGECLLVEGLPPPNHIQQCYDNPDLVEYFEPTGYRRIPLSTCQGGNEMDKIVAHPCPGKEDEFNEKRGIGGFAIFMITVFCFAAAGVFGYWAWSNWERQFGQIRLGEQCKLSPSPSLLLFVSRY